MNSVANLKKYKRLMFLNMSGCAITDELAGEFIKEVLILL